MRPFFILLAFETIALFASTAIAETNNIDQGILPNPDQIVQGTQKALSAQANVASIAGYITFDDQLVNTPIADQYKSQGVVFDKSFIELDNLPNPRYLSGDNESYPTPYGNGQNAAPITANFLATTNFVEVDPVYLDGGSSMTAKVYDKNGAEIGSVSGASRLRVEAIGITRAMFSFSNPKRIDDIAGIDNLKFDPKPIVILDPGHGLLLDKDGITLHYQRPATPTFALHEDDITLSGEA